MLLIFIINFLLAVATTIGMTIIPFLVTESLGYSLLILGIIEGSTEFLSNIMRLANGVLFDKIKHKRLIFVFAVGIAFITKLLLFIPKIWSLTLSRTLERISNGAFAAPRDAYVAENTKNKGLALGLLGFSKSAGCIIGPILVSLITIFIGGFTETLYLLISLCCIFVSLAFILACFLRINNIATTKFSLKEFTTIVKQIRSNLYLFLLFFGGRFNDGLLMIYLKKQGFPQWFYFSTISLLNTIMLLSSLYIGRKVDRGGLKSMIYLSILALTSFNILFYYLPPLNLSVELIYYNWIIAILGLACWGIQRCGSQIVFASLTFKAVAKSQYGTAIGIYYVTSGLATMLASLICGYLAQYYFKGVFILSGSCSVAALIYSYKIRSALQNT